MSSTPNPCDTWDRKVFNNATLSPFREVKLPLDFWISRVDKFPPDKCKGEFVCKPLNLLDFFIESETIEVKIGEEWEVTCKVIEEKKEEEGFPVKYTLYSPS